jgi:hypothetical protein
MHDIALSSSTCLTTQVAMRALGFEPKKEEIKKMISDIDKVTPIDKILTYSHLRRTVFQRQPVRACHFLQYYYRMSTTTITVITTLGWKWHHQLQRVFDNDDVKNVRTRQPGGDP